MPTPLLSQLNSLLGLARHEGIDIRPTLLRVLTDLYVQKPSHSTEEDEHYVELALRLIDLVDVRTRKAVADRLIRFPAAPLAVVRRLAADLPAMAAIEHAEALTSRPAAATAPPIAEPQVSQPFVAEPLAPAVPAPPARLAPRMSKPALPATSQALTDAFFAAGSGERRGLLAALAHSAASAMPLRPLLSEAVARMETDVLAGRPDRFVRDLEGALAVSRACAERIVNDLLGEPMVVAARALAIPLAVLQRMLICLNPAVGHSVERIYSLSALYDDIRRDAALRLAAAWRGDFAEPAAAPRHAPVLYDDERTHPRRIGEGARRAIKDAERKPAVAPSRQRKT